MKSNETVSEFFKELRKKANKVNMDDEAFLFQFLNSLPKSHMQQIIVQNPATAEDAKAIAKTLEQLDNISKSKDSKIALEALKKEMKVSAALNNSRHTKNEELKDLMTEMARSFQNLNSTLSRNNTSTEQRQSEDRPNTGPNIP